MAYRENELGMLVRLSPSRALARIVAAYAAEDGVEAAAARRLGVALSSLKRWRERLEKGGLDVSGRIEVMRAERRAAAKVKKNQMARIRTQKWRARRAENAA